MRCAECHNKIVVETREGVRDFVHVPGVATKRHAIIPYADTR